MAISLYYIGRKYDIIGRTAYLLSNNIMSLNMIMTASGIAADSYDCRFRTSSTAHRSRCGHVWSERLMTMKLLAKVNRVSCRAARNNDKKVRMGIALDEYMEEQRYATNGCRLISIFPYTINYNGNHLLLPLQINHK